MQIIILHNLACFGSKQSLLLQASKQAIYSILLRLNIRLIMDIMKHVQAKVESMGVQSDVGNRIATAIIESIQEHKAHSTFIVPKTLEQEMHLALQGQDTYTFIALLSISKSLFEDNPVLYRLPNASILNLLRACNENVGVCRSILTYALASSSYETNNNDHIEKLFYEFFRACECEANVSVAKQAFALMIQYGLKPKHNTLGRLLAVCLEAKDDEYAIYVYKYMCENSYQFTPYILTKFIGTLLNSDQVEFLQSLLTWCEEAYLRGLGILDNESYRKLNTMTMKSKCREIFQLHAQKVGMAQFIQPTISKSEANTDELEKLYLSHWAVL